MLPVVAYFNGKRRKELQRSKDREQFYREYRELLSAVSGALENGLSVENGFREAERTLDMLYGRECCIKSSVHALNHKVAVRMPVEQAFLEFAQEYPYEEVLEFAQIFQFGKRMGGDYLKNLRKTITKMEESIEVKQEIETNLAEKRLELRVMMAMPIGIIAYIRLTSPDFLQPIYHNVLGYGVMSACLLVYAGCIYLGKRIIEIQV